MKVAVVLTGHMRSWEIVFDNFKERIMNVYKPDIFIETWDDEGHWNPGGTKGFLDDSPKVDFERLRNSYKPIALRHESFEPYESIFAERAKEFTNHFHVPKNTVSMLFKFNRGMQLLNEHIIKTGTQYGLVIRMRPDLVFHHPLPAFDTSKFYTVAHRNHLGQGTSDIMHVGNVFTLNLFSQLGVHLSEVYNNTKIMCPHIISVAYIQMLGLNWQEMVLHKTIMHTPAGEYMMKTENGWVKT